MHHMRRTTHHVVGLKMKSDITLCAFQVQLVCSALSYPIHAWITLTCLKRSCGPCTEVSCSTLDWLSRWLRIAVQGRCSDNFSARAFAPRYEEVVMCSTCHSGQIMQEMFRLGVFSSASQRTISSVIPMLEQAAAPGKTKPKDKLLPFKEAPSV